MPMESESDAYAIRIPCLCNFDSIGMKWELLFSGVLTSCFSVGYKCVFQTSGGGLLIVIFFLSKG